MELSVVYPMFNEEGNVDELLTRTYQTLEKYYKNINYFEVICVDDCSTDNTLNKLRDWEKKYYNLRVIHFDDHKGHPAAIMAGFHNISDSKWAFLSNADLQYAPEEIIKFIDAAKNNKNLKIINGFRQNRTDPFLKKLSSKIYNFMLRKLFGSPFNDHACNFTLYHSKDIKNLILEKNDQRYIIVKLIVSLNLKKEELYEIPISHFKRKYGKSHYSVIPKILFGFFQTIGKWYKIKKKNTRNIKRIS